MHLLFLDLETTGLDPELDDVLEVGWILTEGADLRPIGSYQATVRQYWSGTGIGSRPAVAAPVEAMHTDSGLWVDVEKAHWLPQAIEGVTLDALQGLAPGTVMLAGYSVHFDREFLRRIMPTLHRFLSHRIVDVSTVRTLFWSTREGDSGSRKAHRALADCEESRRELLRYMPYLGQRLADCA